MKTVMGLRYEQFRNLEKLLYDKKAEDLKVRREVGRDLGSLLICVQGQR